MLEENRPVPSGLLGLVQRSVGRMEELPGGDAMHGEAGHPAADRHLLLLAGEGRSDLRSEPLGELIALLLVRLRGEHGELLSSKPRDDVAGPRRPPQGIGELDQGAVAGGVPESIVELLEPIQVEHHDRQRPPAAGRALELAGEPTLELPAVREPGQGVGAGRGAQLGQHPLHLGPQRRPSGCRRRTATPSPPPTSGPGPRRRRWRAGRSHSRRRRARGGWRRPPASGSSRPPARPRSSRRHMPRERRSRRSRRPG